MTVYAARFWQRVRRSDHCWTWTGVRTSAGYGQLHRDGTRVYAHRASWELANGPIPPGMWVLHRCDNPPCVRPDHLFLGTNIDNVADSVTKGRRVVTCPLVCRNGHRQTAATVYTNREGHRVDCRPCWALRHARYVERRRAA